MSIKRITGQRRRELDELENQLRTQGKRGRLGTASERAARDRMRRVSQQQEPRS
jgi:hypothetical protein